MPSFGSTTTKALRRALVVKGFAEATHPAGAVVRLHDDKGAEAGVSSRGSPKRRTLRVPSFGSTTTKALRRAFVVKPLARIELATCSLPRSRYTTKPQRRAGRPQRGSI
jgi:hypothetical protein